MGSHGDEEHEVHEDLDRFAGTEPGPRGGMSLIRRRPPEPPYGTSSFHSTIQVSCRRHLPNNTACPKREPARGA